MHGGDLYELVVAARWPVLVVGLMVLLAALYRHGPSRRKAKWRWVSWGATASALIWVSGSLIFSYYVSRFGHFNLLLGSLGAVILFFLWSYLTVLTILLGAQVNAEMERQKEIDAGHAPPVGEPDVPQMDTPGGDGTAVSKSRRRKESRDTVRRA